MAELSWQRKSGGQNGELSEDTVWLSDPKRRTDPSAGGGRCVNRIAGLYLDGLSYQKLADLLNQKNIPFSQEAPAWDKHKVKRLLENPRYTGQKAIRPS